MLQELNELLEFIRTPTPKAWLDAAPDNVDILLLDHAHCERKAASAAINLLTIAPENADVVGVMSPLAREEMLHFEKVISILASRKIPFRSLSPSNYAQILHKSAFKQDKQKRILDLLLIGAVIEARSCERFAALLEVLHDKELKHFYKNLVKAEARHFKEYLRIAGAVSKNYSKRLENFIHIENEYITSPDSVFRFHSGVPALG